MTWHYRPFKIVSKYIDSNGKKCQNIHWEIREFYNCGRGKFGGQMWTEHAIAPKGDTQKDLAKVLRMMMKDIKHYKAKVIKQKMVDGRFQDIEPIYRRTK